MRKDRKRQQRKRQPAQNKNIITGRIAVTPSGFGFVTPAGGGPDIFIPPKYLGAAIHGDTVEIKLEKERRIRPEPGKGPAGHVVGIVKRKKASLVGQLIAGHKVRPLSKRIPADIRVIGSPAGAERGDWVELELLDTGDSRGGALKGRITALIGRAGLINHDLDAVAKEFNLCPPYSEAENRDAAQLKPVKIPRTDLTGLTSFTIDPQDAKDFDDAISITPGRTPDEVELGVHIADVSAWVQPDTAWDRLARHRSFTAYLPGRTLPMLPKALTGLISLTPGKDALAHSVLMLVDINTGKILRTKRVHSIIRISKRLTFDEVDRFMAGEVKADWDKNLVASLTRAVQLTRKMREYRQNTENFLELATTTIRVICDDANQAVLGLVKESQTEADRLVEECMLAANTEVAREAVAKGIPAVHRVHPEPSPEKIEEFTAFMHETFALFPGDLSSRAACNDFLGNLPDDHRKPIIINNFLRSLPRAHYLAESELHFGLGKGRYCHFTSPIRRYTDLLVHQQLWSADYGGILRSQKSMAKFAADCSEKEANIDEAYYAANDRLKLHYLGGLLAAAAAGDKFYEGIITKTTNTGLLADIPELGLFGFVEKTELGGPFIKRKGHLISRRGSMDYRCGDFIYLRLERVDYIRGTAYFRPVE